VNFAGCRYYPGLANKRNRASARGLGLESGAHAPAHRDSQLPGHCGEAAQAGNNQWLMLRLPPPPAPSRSSGGGGPACCGQSPVGQCQNDDIMIMVVPPGTDSVPH
jgi:hypothetical protein